MPQTSFKPTYAQLLETNHLIQSCSDETYWLCLTRTVQESKLFPVPAYMMLSYLMAFYRYPGLLRKIESRMKAEEIGDRMRRMSMKIQNPSMGWALPGLYLLGREWLINMGLLRPSDAVEDLIYVMDFWKRYELAWHRESGHISNKDFGHRAQILPERTIQAFHAGLHPCAAGDALHQAATGFLASASQYGFLISCESRISLNNSGPYKLADDVEMLVRDFMDLAESDFPWLDDVAADVPHNNLTVPMAVRGVHFSLMDDWGSFESEPDFKAEQVVGVGLYVSDNLSEGYQPLRMESREELIAKFRDLDAQVREATTRLWKRIAAWSRDQMIDAGAITYFAMIKDLAHVAGVYEVEDWMTIDARADRFRPLLNDEFSRDILGELVGYLSLPTQQIHDYALAQHADRPVRMFSFIPHAILEDEPFTATSGPVGPGVTHLAAKKDLYTTTQGKLSLADYNRQSLVAAQSPKFHEQRHYCDSWLKYHAGTPRADVLYGSMGSLLRRGDIAAGTSMADPEAAKFRQHLALHGLAIRKVADAGKIAVLIGVPAEAVAADLVAAEVSGLVSKAGDTYLLTAPAQLVLRADYSRYYGAVRDNAAVLGAYQQFERINGQLKTLITDWQTLEIGGERIVNDHRDAGYDDKMIDRLGQLHERFLPILRILEEHVGRLGVYRALLTAALEQAEDGAIAWVSDARLLSYHTVWFEMHEDLLRILGKSREE